MNTTAERLQAVKSRIAAASHACGRDPRDIVLVAVSKSFSADAVHLLHKSGQQDFGESYAQEAVAKQRLLANVDIVWHFVGPLQSNKTRGVAERFAWVHSVDRLKTAERLSAQRPADLPPLQVCLQVNVSGERSKSGVAPRDLPALARAVEPLPRLKLRGLMAIPEPTNDLLLARRRFDMLRELKEALTRDGLALDSLSMGMSDDLEVAIAAGATMVRVGTAIFGPRKTPSPADQLG